MYHIEEIKDKSIWEKFILDKAIQYYPLFQSWNWGEVQKKLGSVVTRLGVYCGKENKNLIGISQLVEVRAKRGSYIHIRHGPVFHIFSQPGLDTVLEKIKQIAADRKVDFIRLSPIVKQDTTIKDYFKSRRFIDSPIHNMDAQTCWVLDLSKPEEEILKNMRKTHRYLIRKGSLMDIKIIRTQKIDYLQYFSKLYDDLALRKKFVPHKGIIEEFEVFVRDNEVMLFLCEYNKQIIGAAIVLFVGNSAIYHHGATSFEHQQIPSSYLIQWEAIKEAKKRGKKIYNFWGISPLDSNNHPWKGLTLFKTGFGGRSVEFTKSKDLPLKLFYCKTYFIELLNKIIKGY